jgi:hypothetical protein
LLLTGADTVLSAMRFTYSRAVDSTGCDPYSAVNGRIRPDGCICCPPSRVVPLWWTLSHVVGDRYGRGLCPCCRFVMVVVESPKFGGGLHVSCKQRGEVPLLVSV